MLFDEGHRDYHLASDHTAAINSLNSEGVTTIVSSGMITESLLQDFDVLYINEPRTSFTSAEQSAVYNFVMNGGGLFIAHDFNTAISNFLLDSFDLNINSYSSPPGAIPGVDLLITDLEPHPVTTGLAEFYWNYGNALNIGSAEWTVIARYNSSPLLAAREAGDGRIVVIGDNDLFADSFNVPPENVKLYTNIVLWLCGDPCEPPVADAGLDQTVNEGDTVQLDGSASYDPDGFIVSYHWDFGDGTEYTSKGLPSTFTQVTTDSNVDVDPRWNPQGDKIVFESTRSDYKRDLWIIDRDGGSPQKLIGDYGWYERFPAWSPDGSRILYSRGLNDGSYQDYDIWVVNADGTNPHAIRSTSMDERLGDWTPDGNRIVFTGLTSSGNYNVYIMKADGSNPIQLTNDSAWDTHARVNKDGTKIAFMSRGTGSSEIWIMDMDGSNQHQITFDPGHEYSYPDWSPDGNKIIFTKYEGSTSHLWMINADGSNPIQLTTGDSYNDLADWHANGIITFRSTRSGNWDIWTLELGKDPDPKTTHIYGDDGVYVVTLRVTDNDNLSATDTCNITVQNVNPTVTIESITMNVEIGLRVAGRKYNNVSMTLYENDSQLGYVSIERLPGSPNKQMAWIPVSINFSKSYNATVTYIPEDPPNIGGNPVWIYIKSQNGSINKIHHTFNVQQSKKRDSDHWNHVEPWEVDLSSHFVGLPFEITSYITDPGSDDEYLIYSYGSQIVNVTYLNNPPNPDPYPSPDVNPRVIIDTTFLIYEGLGTVILVVRDDDNIRLGVGEGTDSIGLA